MKKNISINLQGLIFHIEEDGYEQLGRYLAEVKAHFARFRGHQDIVADIEGRMAEIFAARLSPVKQVISLADVEEMQAKMGRVSDFADVDADEDDEADFAANGLGTAATGATAGAATGYATATPPISGAATSSSTTAAGEPRRLYRDTRHGKIAGVAAGLGHYFNVNPVWIRLAFVVLALGRTLFRGLDFDEGYFHFRGLSLGGLSLVAYIILWIVLPKRDDAPEPIATLASSGPWAGRRLFRDVDAGKVGGVAAGLAHYFQTDVVLVRVLLLVGVFVGGISLFLYPMLWIAVPVARTVSEKLQMRGDDVTLAGIASSLDATEGQPLGATPNARPVGRFLEGAARGATPLLKGLGTLIRWGVAALLLVMSVSALASIIGLLSAALGVLPAGSVIHMGDNGQAANSIVRLVPGWGAVAAFLAVGIPALALLLLAYRLVARRPLLSRNGNLILLALWIVGVVGATLAGAQVASQFQESGADERSTPLRPTRARSLTLARREQQDEYLHNVNLRFAPADSGTAGSVDVRVRAHGPTTSAARLTAAASVNYGFAQRPDSVLTLDEGIALKPGAPYRNQDATVTLRLPVDKTYLLTADFIEWLDDDDFTTNYQPRDHNAHRARFTAQGKFECLDCPTPPRDGDDEDSSNDNADDNNDNASSGKDGVVNLNLNGEKLKIRVSGEGDSANVKVEHGAASFRTDPGAYGPARRTFNDLGGDFESVEASGSYHVVLRPGAAYHVEAAGRERDLEHLRVDVRGGRLRIQRRDGSGFFPSLNFNEKPVLVTITLPRLNRLELSGTCRADAAGFPGRDAADEFRLKATGACTARVAGLNGGRINVDLSGASRADLSGQADALDADGSGVCFLNAERLKTRNANFDLSGASNAKTNVSNELRADLSGASHVEYRGTPTTINKDLSGASTVKAL